MGGVGEKRGLFPAQQRVGAQAFYLTQTIFFNLTHGSQEVHSVKWSHLVLVMVWLCNYQQIASEEHGFHYRHLLEYEVHHLANSQWKFSHLSSHLQAIHSENKYFSPPFCTKVYVNILISCLPVIRRKEKRRLSSVNKVELKGTQVGFRTLLLTFSLLKAKYIC